MFTLSMSQRTSYRLKVAFFTKPKYILLNYYSSYQFYVTNTDMPFASSISAMFPSSSIICPQRGEPGVVQKAEGDPSSSTQSTSVTLSLQTTTLDCVIKKDHSVSPGFELETQRGKKVQRGVELFRKPQQNSVLNITNARTSVRDKQFIITATTTAAPHQQTSHDWFHKIIYIRNK